LSATATTENIQPFFFGTATQQLYGCFHPAVPLHDFALLLCPPLGDEYIRAHRAHRLLATRLARVGVPVLRFDYYGTGDSGGVDTDATLAQWQANIVQSIDELKRRSGLKRVMLAGLRLGAALALLVSLGRADVVGLALWEPVINGAAYLAELREAHEHKLFYIASASPPPVSSSSELLGFTFAPSFLAEIEALDLLHIKDKPAASILLLEQAEGEHMPQLRAHLSSLGAALTHQVVDDPVIWAEDPDKALVPGQVLQAIITWVTQGAG
jgi:pimeloyl-ACP methyl ester carboxylesterase